MASLPFVAVSSPPPPPSQLRVRRPNATVRCATATPAQSPQFDLRAYWSSLLPSIESQLSAAVPLRYPESIHGAMRHAVLEGEGAKRAPPVLCIAVADLFSAPRSAALPVAAGLEMCHAASLVHDDIPCFDAAETRRGRPSTHALFGVATAVLAGDALFPLSFDHILSQTPKDVVSPTTLMRVVAEISRAVGAQGMASGQFLDITGAAANGEADALLVLERKYGQMAECSAACGAILGGAGEEEEAALRRYGRAVGVLYELVDDVLMASNNGKLQSNASVVRAVGMDRALQLVEELRGKAKEELKRFGAEQYGDRVLPLLSFVDYAVQRNFVLHGNGSSGTA